MLYNSAEIIYKVLSKSNERYFMSKHMKQGNSSPHRSTSIGCSSNSKPKNKHKRRQWKAYRGQGR